eukprot:scaffold20.g7723.t1
MQACSRSAARVLAVARPAPARATAISSSGSQATRHAAAKRIPGRAAFPVASRRAGGLRRRAAPGAVTAKLGGSEVVVVGATGQQAARVVLELLKAGARVTALVDSEEDAAEALAFAKSVELITAAEAKALRIAAADARNPQALASVLPPRARSRVVLVLGDVFAGRRLDARVYEEVLRAVAENAGRVGSLAVVSPAGSSAGVFGRGGGAGTKALAPLEQRALASGVPTLLLRTAALVGEREGAGARLVAAGLGGVPAALAVSRAAVADAVVAALDQARGGSAVIEVGASDEAPEAATEDVVAAALAAAAAAAPAEEPAPAPAPQAGLFGFGTVKRAAAAAEPEEEEEAPAPSLFGAFGTTKKRAPAAAAEEEKPKPKQLFGFGTEKRSAAPAPAEEEAPAPSLFGAFGTTKKRAPAAAAAEEKQAAKPKPTPLFSFGTGKLSAAPAAAAVEEKQAPKPSIFGSFGTTKKAAGTDGATTGKAAAGAARKAADRQQQEEGGTARRRGALTTRKERAEAKAAAAAAAAAPARAAPARVVRARPAKQEAAAAPEKKKSGGFLQALGISQETVYVDEA